VWLWIGGFVIALGTLLALSPRVRRRVRPEPAPLADTPTPEPPPTREPEVVGV